MSIAFLHDDLRPIDNSAKIRGVNPLSIRYQRYRRGQIIMEKIIVLDIEFQFGDIKDTIHPALLVDDTSAVLVDCGYTGFLPRIEEALEKAGIHGGQLTYVVITHQDHDHMGALAALKRKYPHIKVVAGKAEAPYITGEKKSLRILQAEALQETLPQDKKAFGEAFLRVLNSVEPAPVDITVEDGDSFPWCGGCEVIATPGHTPGHISLYLKKHQTVIVGDAAVVENGRLAIANPEFTLDMAAAEASLQKIKQLPAKRVICCHGGVYCMNH